MSTPGTPSRAARHLPEASGSGPSMSDVGTITQEYVNSPYGIARIVLPFEPRVDGIVVIQLPWATAYVSEDSVQRIDDYEAKAHEAERAAKLALQASAKKANSRGSSNASDGQDVAAGVLSTGRVSPFINADSSRPQFPAFAPLKVPMYRRRQTLALTVSSFFSLLCCAVALLCIRANGVLLYAFLAYVVWMLLFQSYHTNGKGFKSNRFRRSVWWTWFRD
jgi:hypothetical protein